jgi:hypothetical protein
MRTIRHSQALRICRQSLIIRRIVQFGVDAEAEAGFSRVPEVDLMRRNDHGQAGYTDHRCLLAVHSRD